MRRPTASAPGRASALRHGLPVPHTADRIRGVDQRATHASPYGVGPLTRVGVAARVGLCVTRRYGWIRGVDQPGDACVAVRRSPPDPRRRGTDWPVRHAAIWSNWRGRPAGDACVAVRRRPPDPRRRYGTDWPVRHTADRIRGVDQRATHASPYGVGPRTRVGVAARIGRCLTRRIGFAGSTIGRRMRRRTASAPGRASALRHGLAGASHRGSDSRGRPAGDACVAPTGPGAGDLPQPEI